MRGFQHPGDVGWMSLTILLLREIGLHAASSALDRRSLCLWDRYQVRWDLACASEDVLLLSSQPRLKLHTLRHRDSVAIFLVVSLWEAPMALESAHLRVEGMTHSVETALIWRILAEASKHAELLHGRFMCCCMRSYALCKCMPRLGIRDCFVRNDDRELVLNVRCGVSNKSRI